MTPTQLPWQHSALQGDVFIESTAIERMQIALFFKKKKTYQSSKFLSPGA